MVLCIFFKNQVSKFFKHIFTNFFMFKNDCWTSWNFIILLNLERISGNSEISNIADYDYKFEKPDFYIKQFIGQLFMNGIDFHKL